LAAANADGLAPENYELRGDTAKSLTGGDLPAERVWPVVHNQAELDPLPHLKTLARDVRSPSRMIE
jgi:hypothetical protein